MKEQIKLDLSDNLLDEENTDTILDNFISRYTQIACNISHRESDDEQIQPFIYDAVKEAYLRRGDEGMNSSSAGSISANYTDIEDDLKKKCQQVRVMI